MVLFIQATPDGWISVPATQHNGKRFQSSFSHQARNAYPSVPQIKSLNEQTFELEQLNSLKESLATDDEVKVLRAYTGDKTLLGAVSPSFS